MTSGQREGGAQQYAVWGWGGGAQLPGQRRGHRTFWSPGAGGGLESACRNPLPSPTTRRQQDPNSTCLPAPLHTPALLGWRRESEPRKEGLEGATLGAACEVPPPPRAPFVRPHRSPPSSPSPAVRLTCGGEDGSQPAPPARPPRPSQSRVPGSPLPAPGPHLLPRASLGLPSLAPPSARRSSLSHSLNRSTQLRLPLGQQHPGPPAPADPALFETPTRPKSCPVLAPGRLHLFHVFK